MSFIAFHFLYSTLCSFFSYHTDVVSRLVSSVLPEALSITFLKKTLKNPHRSQSSLDFPLYMEVKGFPPNL